MATLSLKNLDSTSKLQKCFLARKLPDWVLSNEDLQATGEKQKQVLFFPCLLENTFFKQY